MLDAATAEQLVIGGAAVALVDVTISRQPGEVAFNARLVDIDDARLLAGELLAGPVETGRYLVLVGEAGPKSTYFLSNGLRGSFALDGDSAYQRCPDPGGGEEPLLARAGITERDELVSTFRRAFEGPLSSSPTPRRAERARD